MSIGRKQLANQKLGSYNVILSKAFPKMFFHNLFK